MLLSSTLPLTQAQLTPDVDIECSPGTAELEVHPGSNAVTSVFCVLTNDTPYPEEVNITVDVVGLVYAAPETVNVAAGDETVFEVVYRAELGVPVGNVPSTINARVESAAGVPCITCTEKSKSVTIAIQQFGRPGLIIEPQELLLEPGGSGEIKFKVKNQGNGRDTITLDLVNRSGLEQFGVQFSFSGSSFELNPDETADVTLTVTTTEEVGDGIFEVEITATSLHSVEEEDQAWTISDVFRLQTEAKSELVLSVGSVPAWAISVAGVLGLLAVVAGIVVVVKIVANRRSIVSDDFDFDDEELDFADEFGDLDLDDFEFDDLD